MGEAIHPGPHNGPHSRIAVSAIDDGVSGLTYRKKPTGGRIYVRRNAFINKTGADSWDAFIQSTVRVCGTQLLLEIGSITNIVDGAFVKNKPIWHSNTSGLPRYFARIIKPMLSQGPVFGHCFIDIQAMFKSKHTTYPMRSVPGPWFKTMWTLSQDSLLQSCTSDITLAGA